MEVASIIVDQSLEVREPVGQNRCEAIPL
jgi:hypothetical protein